MSNVTPPNKRFRETMGGFFHDLLKAAGISMLPTTAHDRIRKIGEQLAASIEHNAERKAVEVIRRLQAAVKKGFLAMEADLEKINKRLDALEERTRIHEDAPEDTVHLDCGHDVSIPENVFSEPWIELPGGKRCCQECFDNLPPFA
jgi:hypothetical protein